MSKSKTSLMYNSASALSKSCGKGQFMSLLQEGEDFYRYFMEYASSEEKQLFFNNIKLTYKGKPTVPCSSS